MPLIKLLDHTAPKKHLYVAKGAIATVTPRKDQFTRITLLTPAGSPKDKDLFSTAPLATLLDVLGPHVEVALLSPSNFEAHTSYIGRESIAYVIPTAREDGMLRLGLLNGEELAVGNAGSIRELLDAQSIV